MMNDRYKNFNGLNIAGHFSAASGLGEGARSTVKAIESTGIPFVLNNIPQNAQVLDTRDIDFSKDNPYPVNIIHMNPDRLNWIMMNRSRDYQIHRLKYFWSKYNIGIWTWETPSIPNHWRASFQLFDEIWAPSHYAAKAISRNSPIPVTVIPHSISLPGHSMNRSELNLPEGKFLFLFIFDEYSNYTRKNPQAVIQAFNKAFDRKENNAVLLVKSKNLQSFRGQELQKLAANNPSIILHNQHLSKEKINGLLMNCDCYVSLHRSEGFGLTMADAMYYGKPVIATAYSGNLNFMNASNSFLVDYDLIALTQDIGSYKKGDIWADANIDHAAQHMRHVVENAEYGRKVGACAAKDMKSLLSPEVVGHRIQSRLEYAFSLSQIQRSRYRKIRNVKIGQYFITNKLKYHTCTIFRN